MKKILIALFVLLCLLFVTSCDYSQQAESYSQQIFSAVKDAAGSYLKEDSKWETAQTESEP